MSAPAGGVNTTSSMDRLHIKIIWTIVGLSLSYTVVQVLLNSNNEVVSDASDSAWAFIFAILIAVWSVKEPMQKKFSASFEFSAAVYFAWPLVLPYYLYKTRGYEGLILFLGFAALYLTPFLSGLVAYVYFAE
ncbi:hypothetical protein FT643_22785 [Ketobacter sp. MCCC 1A13808]|uniref:hypothetical protein n=1 Tax=Ketobacter sp. MCCC 1A13808 TaxID=2602738 RepID=UPI0012EB95F8|nr:hypothetical protein [Ketobacter sp. MCCC 1A13808]MVF14957.1 hypothetical protein [Ketobacter sp. MCCC 1A13808]